VGRVAVVGAGPVGLTAALELAARGVPTVVLEAKSTLEPIGSRAIVLARHALATFRRLGCPEIAERGVVLDRARTYVGETELFAIELPRAAAHELPAFVNLQQTYTERALLARAKQSELIEIRWNCAVRSVRKTDRKVILGVQGIGGNEKVVAAYVVACDGAHSTARKLLGLEFPGKTFHDRFLIADVRAEFPGFPRNERRFFFDPPSNRGRQILVHPQPDAEWRIDWQVPAETDAEAERESGALDRRVRALVGDAPYELVWLTAYRFHQRLAERFRVGRVFLAGDAAHLMAPFGARGMNSGVEDVTNLAWKLALVCREEAPESLLDSYEFERRPAARENLRVTGATMRFMAPPTALHRVARNAILRGSVRAPRLRRFVNSGKLATPAVYPGEAPVGGPLPPEAETIDDAAHGFTVAAHEGERLLVRPDGYVAARLDGISLQAALGSALRGDLSA
jgi:2-polyprenyl-6-methoxyphenol hydroxylase-like FAD-dependent oxidoreductase